MDDVRRERDDALGDPGRPQPVDLRPRGPLGDEVVSDAVLPHHRVPPEALHDRDVDGAPGRPPRRPGPSR